MRNSGWLRLNIISSQLPTNYSRSIRGTGMIHQYFLWCPLEALLLNYYNIAEEATKYISQQNSEATLVSYGRYLRDWSFKSWIYLVSHVFFCKPCTKHRSANVFDIVVQNSFKIHTWKRYDRKKSPYRQLFFAILYKIGPFGAQYYFCF